MYYVPKLFNNKFAIFTSTSKITHKLINNLSKDFIINNKSSLSPLSRYYVTHKELNFGVEGRASLLNGVDILSKAVAVTLGPKGRNVLIEQPFGTIAKTKS
ncbi:8066_t:CDS:2 [Entrophospora sp. SA101]|nr:8066_t:CDS:2 [Entrophospora sp. SA101]